MHKRSGPCSVSDLLSDWFGLFVCLFDSRVEKGQWFTDWFTETANKCMRQALIIDLIIALGINKTDVLHGFSAHFAVRVGDSFKWLNTISFIVRVQWDLVSCYGKHASNQHPSSKLFPDWLHY